MRIGIQQPALPSYRVPFFRELAQAARERGDELMVYYGSEEPALINAKADGFDAKLSNFKEWQLPMVGAIRWHTVQWRLVDGYSADVVVLSSNMRNITYWLAIYRARRNNVPVAVWGHGYSKVGSNNLRDRLRAWPMKKADAVLFYDERTAQSFIDAGFDKSKVFVAHNGLDSKRIAQTRKQALSEVRDKSGAKQALDLGDGPVLIYVGRLQSENRLDVLVDAMPKLCKKYPSIKLVIVGGGEAHKAELTLQAKTLNVADSIVWAGAIYNEEELAPWMIAADVFVYPNNVGLSLVHAFNYALPAVICGPLSAHNPEAALVEEGVNTVMAEALSAAALGDAVQSVLETPERCEQMGRQALELVQDKHNVDGMVRGFLAMLDKLSPAKN